MRAPRRYGAAVCALALTVAATRLVSAGCSDHSVVTTDCAGACAGDAPVCVRYSGSALADHSNVTAALNADANGCVVRCLEASVDPVLKVLTVRIPSNAPAIEDVAAITLPASVTGLDMWSDTATIQTFGFPGGNIVANGTLLNFLGLHGISPETLPPAVFDLPLATLRLQLSLSDFPAVTARFKTINTLVLDGSGLTAFPVKEVIGDMPQVRNLSLTGNAITQVPVDDTTTPLYAASALRELALGQNKLTEFSAVFSSIHILDLHGNQLTALPTSLAEMPVLEEVRLSGNPLDSSQLSSQLAAMEPLAGVELLSMSSCGLTGSLPEKFASVFPNLTHLELAQNSLESIKADVVPENALVFLNVSTNKLNSFEGSFPVLQVLDISHNQLESLPSTQSASLRQLNASSNALMSLNISGLTALESLDLSSNKFSFFPASLVWDAPQLAVLRLSGNPDMAPINLTKDQFEKLQGLSHLTVDEGAFGSKACAVDRLATTKHGISVCVTPSHGGELTKNPKETTTKVVTANPNNSRTAGAITTVVLAIGGVIFGVAAYLHSKKRRRKQQQQQALDHIHNGVDSGAAPFGEAPSTSKHATGGGLDATSRTKASSLSSTSSSVNIWNDDELLHLRLDMDTIRFFKVVGMGAYGQVWRGTCRTSSTESRHVAIKTLAPDLARDRHIVKKFIAETKLQATLSHPRVVSVVGVAWNSPTDLCALMEFMPRGDLFATLHYSSSSSCSSTSTLFQTGVWGESKLQIALDIIDALSFAHAQSPVVLHRDLKSRNVLLDAHGRAKLSDFSAATRSSRDESPTIASPLWTAPEVLAGAAGFDDKADVYSFGVILSELDTHEVPFGYEGYATTMLTSASKMRSKQATSPEDAQHKRRLLRQIAAGEVRPAFSPSCPPAILDIAQKCLSLDAALRPSAVEVNFLLRRVEREGSDVRMSSVA